MIEQDDKLIRNFFESNKQEIADRGFSRRVMRNLPQRKFLWFKVCTCALAFIALVFFIVYDGFLGLLYIFRYLYISLAQSSTLYTDPKTIIVTLIVLLGLGVHKIWSMD